MRRSRFGVALGALAATALMVAGHDARAADPADTTVTPYPECPKVNPVSPSNANAAHGAFVAGKASFDAGDYATALTYLKDAYRRDCRKVDLLLIIARSYELLGGNGSATAVAPGARRSSNKREAARALEVYLQRASADADVATQRSHLTRLNEEIARMDAEDEALAAKRAAAGQAPAAPVVKAAATPSIPAAAGSTPAAESPHHGAAPWIVAGIGAAGVAAGAILYGVGSSKESQARSNCNDAFTGCSPTVAADGNAGAHEKTAGIVVLGVGGAALVGGLVWHFVEPAGRADVTVGRGGSGGSAGPFAIEPLLAPGLAGLGAHGIF